MAAAITPTSTAAAQPTGAEGVVAPKIATYNVFMLSRTLYPNWGQHTRADLIHQQGVLAGQDVVVLQELFDNGASDKLLANLSEAYPHQTAVVGRSRNGWDETLGAYSSTTPEDGGTAIVSRWPITRKVQHVFEDSCGVERMSNKGFAYVRLAAPSGAVHVIGTHTQAEDPTCSTAPAEIRGEQRADIRDFIAAQNIPSSEPVYVAGDLNVIGSSGEYATMLAELGAVAPTHVGHRYSWDCPDNSVCLGQYSADYAPEHLDYVLPIAGYAVPAVYRNETRRVKSPEWTVKSWGKTYSYTDYSDHYPVFGSAG